MLRDEYFIKFIMLHQHNIISLFESGRRMHSLAYAFSCHLNQWEVTQIPAQSHLSRLMRELEPDGFSEISLKDCAGLV